MAKIKPASGKKGPAGPKNPQAIGCLVLIAIAVAVVGAVLFYSMGAK
ncbi:MAG: hypothetical protein HY821_25340 [Acidobacteria bacterium]|nr:hypothetical protein [Acidobacteriota bacterium]